MRPERLLRPLFSRLQKKHKNVHKLLQIPEKMYHSDIVKNCRIMIQ